MNSPKINENILEQLFCITLTKSNLNELLKKCSKSEFKKIVENCFARIQIDGHTLIGRISGVCFPVKVQSFQFGLRFHLAMIGLIPLEQILDELPSSPKEFIPWIQDLKKFKMEPPGPDKITQKFDELSQILGQNWKNSYSKIVEEPIGTKIEEKGKDENILNEKNTAETERLMENKNGHKTDDSIDKGDDNNKEANSEMQIVGDAEQPTTSTSIAIPEENVQFQNIEEIVGTRKQNGELFRILISPNEIVNLMQLGKEEFECIMKGLFIYFLVDSKMPNFPARFSQFVAQIESIEWPTFPPRQINYPNLQVKHFGIIPFSNIITQQVHPYLLKLCLITMNKLGLPAPSKEFIRQKHQQLSDARQNLMNELKKPIMNMPQKPVSLLSLRTSPPTKFSCSQIKSIPKKRRRRTPTEKNSCPQPQDNNSLQGKLLPPTNVPNNQIWIQHPPMFNPPNSISITSSGENVRKIMNNNNNQESSSVAPYPDIICLDANKNDNTDSQTTTNLSSTSMENNKDSAESGDRSKQLQMILQKENMQKISNILQKIQQEKTNEKNNGNGKTTTFSPKKVIESEKKLENRLIDLLKKRRASSSSSSTSSDESTLKRMRK